MRKLEGLFKKEESLINSSESASLRSISGIYYERRLSEIRAKITKEETLIVQNMNKYEEALLVLNVRISQFDNANDINEALAIAKEALDKQSKLMKYISCKNKLDKISIFELNKVLGPSDEEQ